MKFNQIGRNWVDGDGNNDGTVNALDFNLLATNFCSMLASPAPGTIVSEPGKLLLAMFSGAVLPGRCHGIGICAPKAVHKHGCDCRRTAEHSAGTRRGTPRRGHSLRCRPG